MGSKGLEVCGSSTVDPFFNKMGQIEGLYEWLKLAACPLGVCLSIGFVATKVTLRDWKDKQSPMPIWRSRL
ncbi:lysophospholipid acyltransferase lpeat2 [Quercus suber]|uniref:Lysophospholipid acyltransferase lpeat2 n=1 Tax=Quercus suber TaxID=58331 RepID=A0AAW0MIV8_QUESU